MTDEKRPSQMDQIYRSLRDGILTLEIVPGERLSERWLEANFGGSRTPIRAALARLETEGLVVRQGRSYMVAHINIGELEHLFVFREAVECAGVRLAAADASEEDIDVVVEMVDACTIDASREEWHRVGNEFHVALARLSGNPFIVKAVSDVMTRLSRARWLEIWSDQGRATARAEHRQILDRIRARDAEGAVAAAATHIRRGRARLIESLSTDRRGLRARGFAVTV